MTWAALLALALWLTTVVVVKTLLRRRWSETAFVALDWRRWTPQDWVASLLAGLALVSLVGATVFAAIGSQLGPQLRPPWPWIIPAGVLIASAITVMVWSQLTMGASWRIGVDRGETTGLVTVGPFHWVRNPIYSAMVVTAIGLAVLVPAVSTFVGTLAMIAFVEWQVRVVEEPYLVHGHGRDYVLWSLKTGRFVPHVGCAHDHPAI